MGGQTTAAADCFNVTIPTTNFLDLVAGVVANKTNYNTGTSAPSTSIAPGAVGFIVTHGLADYAYYNIAASSLGSIGDKIVPVAGSTNLAYAAAGDGRDGLFCNLSTIASATASQAGVLTNVFVRAM
jgi:hypothetical protein